MSDVAVTARYGNRDLNIESSYEYGARVGYWRLLMAFNDRGLKATVNLVGLAGEQNPQALRAMIDSGFDLTFNQSAECGLVNFAVSEGRNECGMGAFEHVRVFTFNRLAHSTGLPLVRRAGSSRK